MPLLPGWPGWPCPAARAAAAHSSASSCTPSGSPVGEPGSLSPLPLPPPSPPPLGLPLLPLPAPCKEPLLPPLRGAPPLAASRSAVGEGSAAPAAASSRRCRRRRRMSRKPVAEAATTAAPADRRAEGRWRHACCTGVVNSSRSPCRWQSSLPSCCMHLQLCRPRWRRGWARSRPAATPTSGPAAIHGPSCYCHLPAQGESHQMCRQVKQN